MLQPLKAVVVTQCAAAVNVYISISFPVMDIPH